MAGMPLASHSPSAASLHFHRLGPLATRAAAQLLAAALLLALWPRAAETPDVGVALQPRALAEHPPIASALADDSPAALEERWSVSGFRFVAEGQEWTTDSVASIDLALSLLPPEVRRRVGNRALGPVHVLVNREGRMLSGRQPYAGPANFFATNDGYNELVLFPGQGALTVLHELGHAYNLRRLPASRYALVFLEPEMQSFMAAAGWRLLSTPSEVRTARDHTQVRLVYEGVPLWSRFSRDDPLEDFANTFALYFSDPEDLRQRSPERFAWFESNLGPLR